MCCVSDARRLCDLLGLPRNPSEKKEAHRLKLDATPRGIAQAEMAADLLGEAIRRNKREGEAIVRETLELKKWVSPSEAKHKLQWTSDNERQE